MGSRNGCLTVGGPIALATSCQGAALQSQNRLRREVLSGKPDKSLELPGVHLGLKYKDAAQPMKGGKFQLKIDDLKKIFKQSTCNMVNLEIEYDGGVGVDDGLFKMLVKYALKHVDSDAVEKGDLMFERKHAGGLWTTTIKTTNVPFVGTAKIPSEISNMELNLETDRSSRVDMKHLNQNKNRTIQIHLTMVPFRSVTAEITDGTSKHDITLKLQGSFGNIQEHFHVDIIGTILEEPLKGKVTWSKKSNVVQIELGKGSKKLIHIDAKWKADPLKIEYEILGGLLAGKLLLNWKNNVLNVNNIDNASKESLELIAKVTVGESLIIEGKKNGESMWTYSSKRTTKRTLDSLEMTLESEMSLNEKSYIHKYLNEKYPFEAFNSRLNLIRIFVDKKHWNKQTPKFKVEVNLKKDESNVIDMIADTTVSPYLFELTAPNLFKNWGIQQSAVDEVYENLKLFL